MRKVDCDENELEKLYSEDGKTIKEVASIFGIGTSTVHSILKRRNVPTNRRANYKNENNKKYNSRDAEIVRLFTEENLIKTEIAEKLGLSRTRVGEIIRSSGATKTDAQIAEQKQRQAMKSIEKHNHPQIVNMHSIKGMSAQEIANEKGINVKTVHNILSLMGVEKRTATDYESFNKFLASERSYDKSHLTKDRDDEIVRLHKEDHFSSIQVAKRMKLSKRTILRVLNKRGIETRSKDDYLAEINYATKKRIVQL